MSTQWYALHDLWIHPTEATAPRVAAIREVADPELGDVDALIAAAPCPIWKGARDDRATAAAQVLERAGVPCELVEVGRRCVCIDPHNPARGNGPIHIFVRIRMVLFWEIGALGEAGRTGYRNCASVEEAERLFEQRISERRANGWLVAGDEEEALRAVSAVNADLERRLLEDPDDLETLAVYGDWLQEQGDPRGELVALQLASQQGDPRRDESVLLGSNRGHLYGLLARLGGDLQPIWRNGFLDQVHVGEGAWNRPLQRGLTGGDLLRGLVLLPAGLLLRKLSVSSGIYQLAETADAVGLPLLLRELTLGPWGSETPPAYGIDPLQPPRLPTRSMRDLHVLRIHAQEIDFGSPPSLPELRELALRPRLLGPGLARQICEAHLPRLERLYLWLVGDENNVEAERPAAGDLLPLLDGRVELPHLRDLALINAGAQVGVLLRALASGPRVRRLETLQLHGAEADTGTLAQYAARYPRLKLMY